MLYPLSYGGGGWRKHGRKLWGRVVIRLRGVRESALAPRVPATGPDHACVEPSPERWFQEEPHVWPAVDITFEFI